MEQSSVSERFCLSDFFFVTPEYVNGGTVMGHIFATGKCFSTLSLGPRDCLDSKR